MGDACDKIKKFIKIEITATNISGTVVRGDGTVFCREHVEFCGRGEFLVKKTVEIINKMICGMGGFKTDVKRVEIKCPWVVDYAKGIVDCEELRFDYYPLAKSVSDKVGLPVALTE